MSNITVTASQSNVSVTNTPSNITVSDGDTFVANIIATSTDVSVTSTRSNVIVSGIAQVGNATIREAISVANISGYGNLTYDSSNTSNGVIQYVGVSSADIHGEFSSENLSGYGTVNYVEANGAIQYTGVSNVQIRDTAFNDIRNYTYNDSYTTGRPSSGGWLSYDQANGILQYRPMSYNVVFFENGDYGDLNNEITIKPSGIISILDNFATTSNIAEGANLYLNGSGTTDDLAEGSSNLWFTNARVNAFVQNNDFTFGNVEITGDLTLPDGNLYISNVINSVADGDLDLYSERSIDINFNTDDVGGSSEAFRIKEGAAGSLLFEIDSGQNIELYTRMNIRNNFDLTLYGGQVIADTGTSRFHTVQSGNITAGFARPMTIDGIQIDLQSLNDIEANVGGSGSGGSFYVNGGVAGTQRFRVNGNTGAVTINQAYTLPTADGSADYVLTTNGSGVVTWEENSNYTNADVLAYLTTTGVTIGGDTIVQGNLEVQGNIDYVNVEDLLVNDQSITLNYGNASARDAFIYVDRSGSALSNAYLKWNETADQWEIFDGSNTIVIGEQTVESVNGQTGVVVLDTDDIAEGSANLYYTTDRANTAIGAYQGSIDTVGDIEANNITADQTITGQQIDLDASTLTDATITATGGSAYVITEANAQPGFGVVNGFEARQSSSTTGDSSNVWAVPRISTYKAGGGTDWASGTITEQPDDTIISALDFTAARYRDLRYFSFPVASGNTSISAGAIVTEFSNTSQLVNSAVSPLFGNANINDARMVFRTMQIAAMQDLATTDAAFYSNVTSVPQSTVMYLDDKLHIGREDNGTSYSLPKTAGTDGQFLQLDANLDLQWVSDTSTYGNTEVRNFLENGYTLFDINANNVIATNFSGDGAGITNMNASNVVGTITNDINSVNVTGTYLTGDGSNITNVLVNYTTDDLTEGTTNLYYSNALVEAYLSSNISTIDANVITANAFIGGTFTGDGSDLTDVRANTIERTVKNVSGVAIDKGYPLHVTGTTGVGTPEVILADAGNALTMPAHFIAGEDLAIDSEGRGILSGFISGIDTATPGFSEGDTIYVAVGGGYANVAPSGEANLIQNLGIVTRIDATNGGGEVYGAGRAAATPALNEGNIFLGDVSNKSVTAVLDTSIVPENGNLYFSNARVNAFIQDSITTTDIDEGVNLYYTNVRVNAFIQDSITTTDIDEGVNLYYTTDRANSAIGAYTGDMLSVDDIVANTVTTSNAITSQTFLYAEQQSNTTIGGIKALNGGSTFSNFNNEIPFVNQETGFLSVQASTTAANVYSVPRFAMIKLPDVDTFTKTNIETVGASGGDFDDAQYAMDPGVLAGVVESKVNKRRGIAIPNYGISYTAEGATLHSTASIIYDTDNSNVYVRSKESYGIAAGQPAYTAVYASNGIMKFRTVQTDILADLDSEFPYTEAMDFANSTVAYLDAKFNIGREDDGTSYSFPKTAGSTGQILELDSNNDLQFVDVGNISGFNSAVSSAVNAEAITLAQFNETVQTPGNVSGAVAFDVASGSIFKATVTGDITSLALTNAVAGTSATLILTQGATTGTLTAGASWLWAGGTKTLSTSTGDVDVISVVYDGTNYYASLTTGYVT